MTVMPIHSRKEITFEEFQFSFIALGFKSTYATLRVAARNKMRFDRRTRKTSPTNRIGQHSEHAWKQTSTKPPKVTERGETRRGSKKRRGGVGRSGEGEGEGEREVGWEGEVKTERRGEGGRGSRTGRGRQKGKRKGKGKGTWDRKGKRKEKGKWNRKGKRKEKGTWDRKGKRKEKGKWNRKGERKGKGREEGKGEGVGEGEGKSSTLVWLNRPRGTNLPFSLISHTLIFDPIQTSDSENMKSKQPSNWTAICIFLHLSC
ncbi:hypothetical protein llap_10130 [Limosa lapponica baueri]|uniref:Uncharacterized protein n=1 Tax=Limosa lapponica baueri TaxID=1758121 RepID=A0A2I0U0M8_LIMLA|nr:hypothetical protein llap_10130 [Limosa lapponica baueri]